VAVNLIDEGRTPKRLANLRGGRIEKVPKEALASDSQRIVC